MSVDLKQCPLCGRARFETAYFARDRHYGISGIYTIVRCLECSLLFLNPMFSDQELSALYPADYYAYANRISRKHWKEIVRSLLCFRIQTKDPEFTIPGRILDLGCGTGW